METTHSLKINVLKKMGASLIAAITLLASPTVSAQAEDEWIDCAAENETCTFEGTKSVRYGGNNLFAFGVFENEVLCGNSTFGDPARRTVKRCSYSSSTNLPPVLEGIDSQFSTSGDSVFLNILASDPEADPLTYIISGLPFGLNYDSATGEITGSAQLIGNFLVSVAVTDSQGAQTSQTFDWVVSEPSEWVLCAGENEFCNFTGTAEVRYGAAPDLYHFGNFTDGVDCGNAVFGDPARRTAKQCSYKKEFIPFTVTEIADRENFVGRQISLQVHATSASDDFNFQASNLPSGLFINESSGLISGTPDVEGAYNTSVTVNDGLEAPLTIGFSWTIDIPLTSSKAASSSSLYYEPVIEDNDRIWVVNPDNNTVSVFDTINDQKIIEIAVEEAPQSISLIGSEAWVTNRDSSTISIINTINYSLISTVNLPSYSQPYGIVTDPISEEVFIALASTGQIIKIDQPSRAILNTLEVGQNIRGLAIDDSGNFLYASRFITPTIPDEHTAAPNTSETGGQLIAISLSDFSVSGVTQLTHSEEVDGIARGRGIPNYLGAMAISPDGNTGWVPSKQDNIKRGKARDGFNLNHENTVRAISSQVDLGTHTEIHSARLDHDNASQASAAIFHPSGNYLFVALETSREVAIVNLTTGVEVHRIPVGRAPQALAISPSAEMLYVHNFMDRSVTKHNVGQIILNQATSAPALSTYDAVDIELLEATVLEGKQLFYDAADRRLALEGYLSCASCHNDGGHDGRVWDMTGFGEGLRNTIPLNGRSGLGHGRLHWTGNFDEVQDFEGQIRGLSGGLGLMDDAHFSQGTRNQALGDSKTGFSNGLDAIAAYLTSLNKFSNSPHRAENQALSAQAQSGKTLFAQSGCLSCHGGSSFSDSNDETLHDIGTITQLSGSRLDGDLTGFDTPTLRGLWESAPYLHDGSAETIHDAINRHVNIVATDDAISDIAAYLLEIDDREETPPTADIWQLCAAENGTCVFDGTKQVRYGGNGVFNFGTFDNSVRCRNSIFGDPIPKTEKFCYYRTSDETLPEISNPGSQNTIINELVSLSLSVTNDADLELSFSALNLPSGVSIDALSGVISGTPSTAGNNNVSIYISNAGVVQDTVEFIWVVTDPSDPNSVWIYCGNEGAQCEFNGNAEVRYGLEGLYSFGIYKNGVACTNRVFGDPAPRMAKTCEYRLLPSEPIEITNPGDQSSNLGDVISLQISLSSADAETVLYSASNLPAGLSINENSGLISGTITSLGTFPDAQISISNEAGEATTIFFTWTVYPRVVGDPDWVFCATENETCAFEGIKEVRYGSDINYFFGVYEDGINCSNSVFGDPTPRIAKHCDVRINGNIPPVINIQNVIVNALNSTVSFFITATDPEGEALSFSASGLPDGITLNPITGEISGSPTTVQVYDVEITVEDESGASAKMAFIWTIQTEVQNQDGWVFCASDGDICNFDGEAKVYFGANGKYISEFFNDSVMCSKSAFKSDPAPGVVKSCYYELDPGASEWTYCSDQDQLCVFDGTKLIRYGAQRAFSQRIATSSIDCSNTEFGDPIQGVFKRCEVKDINSEDAFDIYPMEDNDEQWVFCSPNSFTCHFNGTKQVRYILGDEFSEITATDYVFCSEESFPADPVVHAKQKEFCQVKLSRSEVGEWSNVQSWPVIPVSASLMPDGRILANNATNDDLYTGYSDITLWDPVTNTFSMLNSTASTFAEQSSEMFCTGFDLMPDGNMLLAGSEPNVGGADNLNATRYDFRGERFSRVNDNEYFRYYPSMTTMPNGDMVTFAGTSKAAPLEIFKFDGSWDTLSDTQDTFLNHFSYYAWGQTAPNGQLFYPGPAAEMKYFDLRGEGEEISMGSRDNLDRDYGSYALYGIGKILITGGAKPATDTTTLIDINGPSPIVTAGETMGMPRRHGNLTILANGDLLKTGGHTGTTHQGFEPDKAVYSSELWSPETGQWTTMASMQINRLYHSTAVLLPDGRVMSGGTGYPFFIQHNQANAEIYSPPYLFNADGTLAKRPIINNAPDSVGYDHNFTVDIDSNSDIAKVHMIKLGTVTHHQNFGQRLVPLEFAQIGGQLQVISPEGANIAPPGYYMLIAVDADGRPSVAKITQVLPHSTINLRSGSTGFVLDIAWGDTYENAFASLSSNNANLSQMWSMQATDNGYFKFISRASGYALTNVEGILSLGSDTGSVEEQWRFVEANDGYYALQSRSDNLYLSADMSNPGQLNLSDNSTAGISTQWQVLPVGDINLVAELTGHLLDAGDTEYNSSDVFVEHNEGSITQAWYFEAAQDGYSYIRARSGLKALALADSGAGSSIIQENIDNSEHQQWRLAINNDGSFKIESRSSQLPLANNTAGAGLTQLGASNSSEAWRIVPAVSGQPENTSKGGGQVLYRTLIQETGLLPWRTNGHTSGSSNLDKAIETLEVHVNGIRDDLGIEYQVFDETTGWSPWVSDGAIAGEIEEPIYGMQARLIGENTACSLRYRVYADGNGWMAWSNAETIAGSDATGDPVNGLQITVSCQDSVNSAPSTASAKLSVTANQSNINFSSFRKNAFEIANTSLTQKIEKVKINLSNTFLPDIVFDPIGLAGDPITACFDEGAGGPQTGLLAPIDECSDPYSLPKDGGYSAVTLEFNDFDPGESFFFGGDIDPTSIKNAANEAPAGAVSGLELSGASVTVYFDDGSTSSNNIFPDGSNAGGQSCLNSDAFSAPMISLSGGAEIPSVTSNDSLSLDVFGEVNSVVKVFVLEAALFGDNGFDIDPFESNSVVQIREYLVVTDNTGSGFVDIELTQTSSIGGYNHIIAASDQGLDACTGNMTKFGVVQYSP